MKAISIKQPWASLIAHGIKDIENRTWKCPQKYLGQRVLIHASKGKGDGWVLNEEQGLKLQMHPSNLRSTFYDDLPFGAIIGSVVISDCVQNHPSVWAEKGCWNWVLKDAVLFEKPIQNVKGKLSFWNYDFYYVKNIFYEQKNEMIEGIAHIHAILIRYLSKLNS